MTPKWEIERGLDYTAIVARKLNGVVWVAQVCDSNTYSAQLGAEFPSRAEAEANARLIAAAPEMLGALIRAERKLRAYVGVCKGDKELTDTILPMAGNAIAKAT